jgi:RHS repeat-associated protein
MNKSTFKPVLVIALSLAFLCVGQAYAQAPTVTTIAPTSGPIGILVQITGTGFGATQGSSMVSFNGTNAAVMNWTATSVAAIVPSGASSGPISVKVNGQAGNSSSFTVTPLPSGWTDSDVGSVGIAGSASYANGTFTVKGSGQGIYGTSDQMHFMYQPLSGDGTIVARLVSWNDGGEEAGVMIRETLTSGSTSAYVADYYDNTYMFSRLTTGASTSLQDNNLTATLPYWLKLVRSGNTFSSYQCADGVNWVQVGSSVTITMAQNVYIGVAVTSGSNSILYTGTFDNVSISSAATPAPVITSIGPTTSSIGAEVLISGSGFGATEGSSLATLNALPATINAWSDTAIVATIPSGAASGLLVVSVGPSMNGSNPDYFEVTSQPLPGAWLDDDIGTVGLTGSATYSNGTFTVNGSGHGTYGAADGLHFAYQSLSGDGTIVARLFSESGSSPQVGLMIRETLNAGSAYACIDNYSSYTYLRDRPSTGANTAAQTNSLASTLPYWLKLVRTGNSFSGYYSPDGLNWSQVGSSVTVSMATNVYIGLFGSGDNNPSMATGTFDNLSVSSTSSPAPVITSISATTGAIGNQVLISGSGFGTSQGSSAVMLNDQPMTVKFWGNTSITFTIATGATTGPLVVSVAPNMNDSNALNFTVTSQPLPTPWLDGDVGLVGIAGSATYSSGAFTLKGSGQGIFGVSDHMHFVYQPLTGDGTIVARLVSWTDAGAQAGVMIRETLSPGSTSAYVVDYYDNTYLFARTSTGGNTSQQDNYVTPTLPYWVKVVRSGNTFSGYYSADGVTWAQVGTSQTITMAQTVNVGLAVSSDSNSSLATATFDNVTVTAGLAPLVQTLSPTLGGVSTSVTISGISFGSTQGTSTVAFNGALATSVTSWNNTQIVALVPSTVASGTGPVVVTVNSVQSNTNVLFTAINPVISSVSPPSGEGGGQVTLNGSGFGGSQGFSTVQFNGTSAGTAYAWSDTSITVKIPSGATTGPVTVTEDGITSNGVQFTVTSQFSVTAISPAAGPVGTSVTITGTGFGSTQSNSTASFDGVAGTVTSWSNTQVVAVVPSGASTGPVSITVAGLAAYGPSFQLSATVQLTDSQGHQTTYTSVIAGGKWYVSNAQGSGCSTCTVRGSIQTTYDNNGNVLTRTDELGRVTTYTYDANNNVTSIVQPAVNGASPTTRYTYNNLGEVLTMIDPLGQVTTNTYDSHGNLLTVTTPAPNGNTAASVTQFAYNSLGELTQITDALGRVTTLTYTTVGLIATITDPQHNVTTYQYDSHGNRTSITDAMNNQTTFTYDAGDRLTKITYPGGTITSTFTYDYRGRRITATDQNGKTTTYTYDDEDRLTSVKDAASNITQYTYDTENNLLNITDANSHTTNFTYDAFGRVTETTFPSNLFETYAYDAANNLTSKTDRKNQTIQYVYDALNRLTQKSYPNSTSVNYIYDLASKIQQVSDPTGTYGFSYDNMGRLTGTTTQFSFVTGTYANSYSYDANSNRTGFTAPDGSTNTYTYDTLNRLSTLANSWAGSFGFTYDALNRRTQMTRPNNVATNYSYDSLSHLLSVLHQLSGSTIDGATYTVDSAGNRTAKTDNRATVTSNYGYDAVYELLQTTQGGTTTESYTYDPVGNRLSSLGVSPYSNNTSNELTSTPSASYTYDNDGNTLTKMASSSTTSYTWDYENRLTSVVLPGSGGTATFKYDPFGRRIQKTFTQGSTTTTTNYVYDGNNSVQDVDQNGNLLARYTETLTIDEPVAESRGGTTSYYETDGLGSVTTLSNAAGALANTYTYDSYGKLTASTGSTTNRFQYTARESDSETGLYFYRARYYDPNSGRFLNEDPLQFEGGINFYSYTLNNPASMIDPIGEAPCSVAVKCRGINDGKLRLLKIITLGAVSFDHCYIATTDQNGVGHILSAGPDPTNFHRMTSGDSPLSKEPNLGKDKNAPVSPCPNDCDVEKCLENQTTAFQNSFQVYDFRGKTAPNSNSAVDHITKSCGLTVTFPKKAKGWDYFSKQGLPQ